MDEKEKAFLRKAKMESESEENQKFFNDMNLFYPSDGENSTYAMPMPMPQVTSPEYSPYSNYTNYTTYSNPSPNLNSASYNTEYTQPIQTPSINYPPSVNSTINNNQYTQPNQTPNINNPSNINSSINLNIYIPQPINNNFDVQNPHGKDISSYTVNSLNAYPSLPLLNNSNNYSPLSPVQNYYPCDQISEKDTNSVCFSMTSTNIRLLKGCSSKKIAELEIFPINLAEMPLTVYIT